VGVLKDDVGSGVSNRGVVAELLEHKLSDFCRISNRYMNQKVLGASQEENLNHLRVLSHALHEGSKV
jgi:hypothetical protein